VPAEPQHLLLTTTGRRTGLPREVELWFTRRGGAWYIIAEHGRRAQWVLNLRADPRVRVRVGRARFSARARVPDATTEAALVRAVRRRSEAKYGWGDGLVVELRRTTGVRGARARTGRARRRR
jgi:deazaflavin-dependent oxidoreductase (nitroreductase family)